MTAPSIDKEFMQYWQKLPPAQKQSLLCLAKSYVDAQEAGWKETGMDKDAALPGTDRNYLTQEEVEEESEKWCRKCTGYFGQL